MQLSRTLTAEQLPQRGNGGTATNAVDLSEYKAMVQDLPIGTGAEVTLDDGESERATKRRLNKAAATFTKQLHFYKTTKNKEGRDVLKFKVEAKPTAADKATKPKRIKKVA